MSINWNLHSSAKPTIAIAGTGAVARSLSHLLMRIGEAPAYLFSRESATAQAAAHQIGGGLQGRTYDGPPCDMSHLIIAVPDTAVESVAAYFKDMPSLRLALHTAGGLPVQALNALASLGTSTAVLHPLQTMPAGSSVPLEGPAFAVWGDGLAAHWAEQLVTKAHGLLLRIDPEQQGLYHAAAVMASNQLLALLDASEFLLARAGIAPDQARRALRPLVTRTIEGGLRAGPATALTGPVARGNVRTVCSHLLALSPMPQEIKQLYLSASLCLLTMAKRQGKSFDSLVPIEAALLNEG